MEEDNTGVGGQTVGAVQADTSKPVEPTVVINNREVPVSQAPEVLRQMEHDLKSGYDRKLIEERQATKAALTADKEFYATHPAEAWEYYEPTVDGGRGWVGQGEAPKMNVTTTKGDSMADTKATQAGQGTPAFDQTELADLRTKQAELSRKMYEQDVARSITARDSLAAKYPLADLSSVTAQMKAWDLEHGLQACPNDVVEQFMSQSHAFVDKQVQAVKATLTTTATTEVKTATPALSGGTTPGGGKQVIPSLNDVDGFTAHIASKL